MAKVKENHVPIINFLMEKGIIWRSSNFYFFKGEDHIKKGDYSGAIIAYSNAIMKKPLESNFYNARGIAYTKLKKFQSAVEDFDEAIKLEPKKAEFYFNRWQVRAVLDGYQKAINDYEKALKLDKKYSSIDFPEDLDFKCEGCFSYLNLRGAAKEGRKDIEGASVMST
jgi:tetratricopeptide (TPR) repeat protein